MEFGTEGFFEIILFDLIRVVREEQIREQDYSWSCCFDSDKTILKSFGTVLYMPNVISITKLISKSLVF